MLVLLHIVKKILIVLTTLDKGPNLLLHQSHHLTIYFLQSWFYFFLVLLFSSVFLEFVILHRIRAG